MNRFGKGLGLAICATAIATTCLLASPNPVARAGGGTNTLNSGETLSSGQSLISYNGGTYSGQYCLLMQSDGNLVEYVYNSSRACGSGNTVVWAMNNDTLNSACNYYQAGAYAVMQTDGNFVVYNPNGGCSPWSSNTSNSQANTLVLQDDGNAVVYKPSGGGPAGYSTLGDQHSGDLGVDGHLRVGEELKTNWFINSLSATQYSTTTYYQLLMQGDGNLVLYQVQNGSYGNSWSAGTSNNLHNYAILQSDGNFVVYNPSSQGLWSSNTSTQTTNYVLDQTNGNLGVYKPGTPDGAATHLAATFSHNVDLGICSTPDKWHWYAGTVSTGGTTTATKVNTTLPSSWSVDQNAGSSPNTGATMDEAAWLGSNSSSSNALEGGYYSGFFPYDSTWTNGLRAVMSREMV